MTSNPVDEWTIARHEAGHTVARWLLLGRATGVELSTDGGYSHGTGKPIASEHAIIITLAGFAVEAEHWMMPAGDEPIKLISSRGDGEDDITIARSLLRNPMLLSSAFTRGPQSQSMDAALVHWLTEAARLLWPYRELIEVIADELCRRRALSARSVAALIREWSKREREGDGMPDDWEEARQWQVELHDRMMHGPCGEPAAAVRAGESLFQEGR